MTTDTKSFAQRTFAELNKAKKMFGKYTYHDKGATEIMDLGPILQELRGMSANEAGRNLKELDQMDDTATLMTDLISSLADWDEFFDHPDHQDLIGEYY